MSYCLVLVVMTLFFLLFYFAFCLLFWLFIAPCLLFRVVPKGLSVCSVLPAVCDFSSFSFFFFFYWYAPRYRVRRLSGPGSVRTPRSRMTRLHPTKVYTRLHSHLRLVQVCVRDSYSRNYRPLQEHSVELANFAAESVSSFPLMPTYAGIRENKTFPFICTSLKFISTIFPLIVMHRQKFVYGFN